MKRAELVRHLTTKAASYSAKVAATHLLESSNRKTTAVPRHSEILTPMVNRICKDLAIPRPGE